AVNAGTGIFRQLGDWEMPARLLACIIRQYRQLCGNYHERTFKSMRRNLEATIETFPIAGLFTISRGSKTEAEVVTCAIEADGLTGRGECVPYRRYGETLEGVLADV